MTLSLYKPPPNGKCGSTLEQGSLDRNAHGNNDYSVEASVTQIPDYFVAPFASDGELIGVAGRLLSELSPRWLGFCNELLASQASTFCCQLPLPPLAHISLQVTSSNGAALVNLAVHDQPASSGVALTGCDPASDSEVLRMFVDSMRGVQFVQQATSTPTPFESVFGIVQRPLYVVIPWGNPQISNADQQLVQELENHLAAALLVRPVTENGTGTSPIR